MSLAVLDRPRAGDCHHSEESDEENQTHRRQEEGRGYQRERMEIFGERDPNVAYAQGERGH